MSIRKVKGELASLRREVEATAAEPQVVMTPGYGDDAAGPPVVLGRLPGMVILCDPQDAGL